VESDLVFGALRGEDHGFPTAGPTEPHAGDH
jgi:hypothetical protein